MYISLSLSLSLSLYIYIYVILISYTWILFTYIYIVYVYVYIYIYIYIFVYRRFRGASPVYPTPRNREIGFVSSSFSFRACRACERGEAVRAHVERYPYRWASRVLGSTCCACAVLLAPIFCVQARGY